MKNFKFYSPDEVGGGEVATTETAATDTQTQSPAATTWIDTETGTFSDNWRDTLPEELRGEKCLEPYTDFAGMAKSLVHNVKAYGKDKIVIPNENSTEADWDAFYKVAGRPDTVGDYAFTYDGEDAVLNDSLSPEIMNPFLDDMHRAGASKKIIDVVKKYKAIEMKAQQAAIDQANEAEITNAETALKTKWGPAYQERIGLANRVVDATTPEGEQRDALREAIGNNPLVLEWIADQVGTKLVETKLVDTTLQVKTPMEINGQIGELQATEGYMDGSMKRTNPTRFESITQQIRALHLQLNPK